MISMISKRAIGFIIGLAGAAPGITPRSPAQDCQAAGAPAGPVLEISELDPGGSNEWIEVYNPSDCPERLDDYILKVELVDGISASARLPGGSVAPRGYSVICLECHAVFCSSCVSFDSSDVSGLDRDGGVISLYWQSPCDESEGPPRRVSSVRYPSVPSSASFPRTDIESFGLREVRSMPGVRNF